MCKGTVLVLNKNWHPLNVVTSFSALKLVYTNVAASICIETMTPHNWREWTQMNLNDSYQSINTPQATIKIPKVILLLKTVELPLLTPKLTSNNIYIRDNFMCQYTGKKLSCKERSIDHIIPKSRGGKTTWSNCVLCHKDVNLKKGNKTPKEAGLVLINTPTIPVKYNLNAYFKSIKKDECWDLFL